MLQGARELSAIFSQSLRVHFVQEHKVDPNAVCEVLSRMDSVRLFDGDAAHDLAVDAEGFRVADLDSDFLFAVDGFGREDPQSLGVEVIQDHASLHLPRGYAEFLSYLNVDGDSLKEQCPRTEDAINTLSGDGGFAWSVRVIPHGVCLVLCRQDIERAKLTQRIFDG